MTPDDAERGPSFWRSVGRVLIYATVTAVVTLSIATLGSRSQQALGHRIDENTALIAALNRHINAELDDVQAELSGFDLRALCARAAVARALNEIEAELGTIGPRVVVPLIPDWLDCSTLAGSPPASPAPGGTP